MSTKPRAIVISGNGTNCEREAAEACRLGGFDTDIVHISRILSGEVNLESYHFLNLTGGFLDGDDLGAAMVQANRLKYAVVAGEGEKVSDHISRFISAGKPILGVCNGFQLMVKMGLLPGLDGKQDRSVTLTFNDSGRFEDRWVTLLVDEASPCIFTKNLQHVPLPVRHGEGKFIARDDGILDRLRNERLLTVRYMDPADRQSTMNYPENPNGSVEAVAGICSPSGLLFGLMPHPEAYLHRINHPRWTREELPEEGTGVAFFRNAYEYVVQAL
jgi:phosphoribosylformylglycinamidine synthase